MNIHIANLRFAYPRRSFELAIPQLEIESGARVAFVGPSGSGKTTLLRLIGGIYTPQAGELTVDGAALPTLSDAQRRAFRITRIGFVFQDFQLIDYLDVAENIRLPFRIHRALRWNEDGVQRLAALAAAAGIADKLARPVEALSYGEQQRVALCRALITGPDLVLADEPTGNLDPVNKQRVLELLFEQTRRHDATLVMVTHDTDLLGDFERVIDFQQFTATSTNAVTPRAGAAVGND